MSGYKKHVFFCVNQREQGRQCCQNAQASTKRNYAKNKIKELGLAGQRGVRINAAGCLGRCSDGPVLVIYPEGVWYTYKDENDIAAIIEEHLIAGNVVESLRLD